MRLQSFGFIVTGGRFIQRQGTVNLKVFVVGVEAKEEAIQVAREMVQEGVQLIELCGGFGPVWAGRIIEAIGGSIPVGAVTYGLESVSQMSSFAKAEPSSNAPVLGGSANTARVS